MITTIDDKRPKTQTQDPWADWKPQWQARTKSPHDLQERHSPTETATIRPSAQAPAQENRRRIVDARLWGAMTPAQQNAALEIATAFDMMGRGMGYVISNWERIPGCRSTETAADVHARLINTYVGWANRCAKEKISHAMVVDVLCFGFSCRMIDQDRRLRNGSTRQNLLDGLTLYCTLRGW